MLVYGPSGIGKTQLAGTSNEVEAMRDILYADAEGGVRTIRHQKGIDYVRVTNFRMLRQLYEFVRRHCQARDADDIQQLIQLERMLKPDAGDISAENVKRYNTVVIDSLYEVQKYLLYQVLGVDMTTYSFANAMRPTTWDDWRNVLDQLRAMIRQFRDLPINVIMTCNEGIESEEGVEVSVGTNLPGLQGKAAREVQMYFDVVGYYRMVTVKEGDTTISKRRLFLQPGPRHQAKNRFSEIKAPFIDSPTMEQLAGPVLGS